MELDAFLNFTVAELLKSNGYKKHPFRLCTFASLDEYPSIRTVVKRKTIDKEENLFYTDIRSAKVKQLRKNPHCTLHFYHPKKRLQVIIQARAQILTEGALFEHHKQIALLNPQDYSTALAPGSKVDQKSFEIGDEENFCLIKCVSESIEILMLDRPQHLRAKFERADDWKGSWLVP
jgi:hypothetical protein